MGRYRCKYNIFFNITARQSSFLLHGIDSHTPGAPLTESIETAQTAHPKRSVPPRTDGWVSVCYGGEL